VDARRTKMAAVNVRKMRFFSTCLDNKASFIIHIQHLLDKCFITLSFAVNEGYMIVALTYPDHPQAYNEDSSTSASIFLLGAVHGTCLYVYNLGEWFNGLESGAVLDCVRYLGTVSSSAVSSPSLLSSGDILGNRYLIISYPGIRLAS
jgi:hypothetical protein